MERWEFYDLLIEGLGSLYGSDIPDGVIKRYVREKNNLQLSEFQDEFRAFGELLMEMKQKQMLYSIIGTALHSFLLYILLQSEMNPLPPHYYCLQCKKVIFAAKDGEISMGIDLPRMVCECGCELRGDGFDLSDELFWETEPLDLKLSVSEENYEFVIKWLCKDERLKGKDKKEEKGDDERIVKVFRIGIISVLALKSGTLIERKLSWYEVRNHKEKVYNHFELLLPCNQKIKYHPKSLYEVIRWVAYFNTMYTKNKEDCINDDDILEPDEMCLLLEKFYEDDINKAPVFQEEGLDLDEWSIGDYRFLLLFTRAFAEVVLDKINDKMRDFIME